MDKKNLISTNDFVLYKSKKEFTDPKGMEDFRRGCVNYANLQKRTLTPGDFIPTDKEGNVMRKPTKKEEEWCNNDSAHAEIGYSDFLEQYQEAKERVLFKDALLGTDGGSGYILECKGLSYHVRSMEELTEKLKETTIESIVKCGISLTESAIKLIYD